MATIENIAKGESLDVPWAKFLLGSLCGVLACALGQFLAWRAVRHQHPSRGVRSSLIFAQLTFSVVIALYEFWVEAAFKVYFADARLPLPTRLLFVLPVGTLTAVSVAFFGASFCFGAIGGHTPAQQLQNRVLAGSIAFATIVLIFIPVALLAPLL